MASAPTDEVMVALLDDARAAAAAGAGVLNSFAGRRLMLRTKGEVGNLVTDADLAAEHAVRSLLHARRPGDSVSGEEMAAVATGSRVRWVIDPLDGTTNFTRNLPFYATSVAAFDTATQTWVVAAVDAPALGRQYWAGRGMGAWLGSAGKVRRLHGPDPDAPATLLGTGLSYSAAIRDTQLESLPELMAGYTDLRRLGSAALDLCLVADGSLDGFVESDLAEHDWAGGALIAREAGLQVELPQLPGDAISALPS